MNMLILVVGVTLLLLLVVLLLVRLNRRAAQPATVAKISETAIVIRDTKAGRLLRDFLSASYAEPEATTCQSVLDQMKDVPEDIVEEIGYSYSRTQPEYYTSRWALVYVACKLAHQAPISFLDGVVRQPIPPEESTDIHHFSSVAQETTIRMRAIRGIGQLADAGAERAKELLLDYLSLSAFSLRAFAAYTLLRLPNGESFRARISRTLPPDEQFVLELKTARVQDVAVLRKPEGFSASARPRSNVATKPSVSNEGTGARQTRNTSKSKRAPIVNPSAKGGQHG